LIDLLIQITEIKMFLLKCNIEVGASAEPCVKL